MDIKNRATSLYKLNTPSQKGFTVVELMITIIIVAILATIAAPSFLGMMNRNKVIAATNELSGLIQFAKNTAKTSGKPTVIFDCQALKVQSKEKCDWGVAYVGSIPSETSSTGSSIRVLTWPSKVEITGTAADGNNKSIVFNVDGTRGLHKLNKESIAMFNEDGSFNSKTQLFSGLNLDSDYNWKIKSKDYCRKIQLSSLGDITVTEGCQ